MNILLHLDCTCRFHENLHWHYCTTGMCAAMSLMWKDVCVCVIAGTGHSSWHHNSVTSQGCIMQHDMALSPGWPYRDTGDNLRVNKTHYVHTGRACQSNSNTNNTVVLVIMLMLKMHKYPIDCKHQFWCTIMCWMCLWRREHFTPCI